MIYIPTQKYRLATDISKFEIYQSLATLLKSLKQSEDIATINT